MDLTPQIVNGRAIVFPCLVHALVYHTVESTTAHTEGETYSVGTAALLETLIGIGFVEYVVP
jgi:hypothetical protein